MSDTTSSNTFDVLILGGGSGGYACAFRAAQLGLSVGLIEKDKLGGTCLHRGCIPTKALLHAAEVADHATHAASVGVKASFDGIDMPGVHKYKDGIIERLYKGLTGLATGHKVTMINGTGKMTGPKTIEVDGQTYTGKNVVLATGSYARSLPGIEIGGRVMTSDQALTHGEVPGSVIVLGGGVIGVEFASVYRSFGANVTVIEASDRLCPAEDPASSKALTRAFKKRKIDVKVKTMVASVEQDDTSVTVTTDKGKAFTADMLLVSVGRGPVTEGLGYEEHGIKLDRGFVTTDERLRTGVDGVFAVGDIVPGVQLAHRGFAHGIFVAEEIAGLDPKPVDDVEIPKVTYCDPEIASVGLTEAQAKEKYGDDKVATYEYNLAGNGKSQILATAGFIKLVREVDGPIVGVHTVGARMGEQIGEGQLIVSWEAHPEDVAGLIHAHPTQNEAMGEAHLALSGKPLHAHA